MNSGGGALTAEQLSVEYRGAGWRSRVLAVRNATLRVNAGEVVGLVGESGSGKSSVARALVGLAPVTAGVMQLDDTVLGPSAPRSRRRLVQMVFQNPRASLNPRRTVRQALTESVGGLAGPGEVGAAPRPRSTCWLRCRSPSACWIGFLIRCPAGSASAWQ